MKKSQSLHVFQNSLKPRKYGSSCYDLAGKNVNTGADIWEKGTFLKAGKDSSWKIVRYALSITVSIALLAFILYDFWLRKDFQAYNSSLADSESSNGT